MRYLRKDLEQINKQEVANKVINYRLGLTEKERNKQDIWNNVDYILDEYFLIDQKEDESDFNDVKDNEKLNDYVSDVVDLINKEVENG